MLANTRALDSFDGRALLPPDMHDRRTRQELSEWLVLEAFVLLAAAPWVLSAALGNIGNGRSIIATCIAAIVVVALVLRRRGAWWILVAFYGVVVVSYAWDRASPLLLAVDAAALLLLVSRPMRRYVAKGHGGARARRLDGSQPLDIH